MAKISFLANGTVNQEIDIIKEGLTVNDLVLGLNSGKYFTTMGEDKTVVDAFTNETVANIVDTDNQLEYNYFESIE
jgi:hypothetical protein